jgi:hypothetical protein
LFTAEASAIVAFTLAVIGLMGFIGYPLSYNQNLWIDHPFEGAAYLPR